MVVKFGTDGWRGVIAKDFTYENLKKVALAHAALLRSEGLKRVFVGYDRRFMSENFAKEVAAVFFGEGLEVTLAEREISTPAVSWAVRYRGYDNGVVITASHNPYTYNGYKIKDSFGGSATPEFVKKVEELIDKVSPEREAVPEAGEINRADYAPLYIDAVRERVNLELFKERELTVVHDPMFGAAAGYLSAALNGTKVSVSEIRSYRDPLFGGGAPEPVEKNAAPLKEKVRALNAFCGFMNDGDGDRVALVDERGEFVNSQLVYAMLLLHVLENKGKRGAVVKTVSTTYLADRIAREFGVKLIEVPVGFKHINAVILERGDVIFGGEESGGYGFPDFLPERDGLLSALYLLELFLLKEKTPSRVVEEIFSRFGEAYYKRLDLPVKEEQKKKLAELVKNPPQTLGGLKVKEAKTIDGLKLVFENDAWVLMRPSGTEPLLRLYAEAPSPDLTQRLLNAAAELVRL